MMPLTFCVSERKLRSVFKHFGQSSEFPKVIHSVIWKGYFEFYMGKPDESLAPTLVKVKVRKTEDRDFVASSGAIAL